MKKTFLLSLILVAVCGAVIGTLLLKPRENIVVRPGDDVQAAIDAVADAGTVVLEDGQYEVLKPIRITRPGVTLTAANPRAARLVVSNEFVGNPKTNKGTLIRVDSANVTIRDLVLDGQFIVLQKAIEATDTDDEESQSHGLVVDNCEIFHFTHHAIDIDGDDATVRECLIYENLLFENGARQDVHGVVTTNAQRLTVENCTIRNCSGDCVQGERGIWDMLTIVDCELSGGALPTDLGGFKKGDYASENAFDSKHRSQSRGRVAIRNCTMHGFRTDFRDYMAAVVLKENVDAVIDSCEISDSSIALRLRGLGKGVMRPVVMNCMIRGNDLAFRLEDQLQKFRLLHCTIVDNEKQTVWAPGKRRWKDKWDNSEWALVNNLWVAPETVPELATAQELGAAGNAVVERSEVDDRLVPLHPLPGIDVPPVVDEWYESTGRVVQDKDGTARLSPSTVGAFEWRDGSGQSP
ncbi:MAG: right-handed parallel beta-helix repeat-containing protein [Planctomycetaceae bacterium]